MVINFFVPQLAGINLSEMWFQQDGATCHTARDTINLLKETFGERIISRNGPVNLPPTSCGCNPTGLLSLEICQVTCCLRR